jgi:hypothetical protein
LTHTGEPLQNEKNVSDKYYISGEQTDPLNLLLLKCTVELVAAIDRDEYKIVVGQTSGLTEMVTPDGVYTVVDIKGDEMRLRCTKHHDDEMVGIELTLVK